MAMFNEGILTVVGNTPLIKLNRFPNLKHLNIYAKLEMFNPGGSIKDRTAVNLIKQAIDRGDVIPGKTTVMESSSGNLGIGLAQICNLFDLPFICIVDPLTTKKNIQILEAYGARIELVTQPDANGQYLPARLKRVNELLETIKGSYWTNQYCNLDNPSAHHETMRELSSQVPKLDYLFCAISSCGTLRGCVEYITNNGLDTKVIAVDAEGSGILGDNRKKRLIPGHGAARAPEIYQDNLQSSSVLVSDKNCIEGCKKLLKYESILAGGSSGGVIAALEKIAPDLPENTNCAVILCDSGIRYLDTVYSNSWVNEHFPA